MLGAHEDDTWVTRVFPPHPRLDELDMDTLRSEGPYIDAEHTPITYEVL